MKKYILFILAIAIVAVPVIAQDTTAVSDSGEVSGTISTIISLILAGVSTIFATLWGKIKTKLAQVTTLFSQVHNLLVKINEGIEDGTLSKDEIKGISAAGKAVAETAKGILKF